MNATDDLSALTLTMIGEDRGGGDLGMIAVGNTIMNRVRKKSWYGQTPLAVCLRHSATGVYQYSCWNADDPNRAFLLALKETDTLYQHVKALAQDLLDGTTPDNTFGSCHYYAIATDKPYWALGKAPVTVIAGQAYYNNVA